MISQIYKDPPPKVLKMFQACTELMEEGMDVHDIKVVDITNRAGIGKGTAYEYFKNKEELIAEAQWYYFNEKFRVMKEKVAVAETFWDAIDCLCEATDGFVANREGLLVLFKHAVTNVEDGLSGDREEVCQPPENLVSFFKDLARRAIEELHLKETSEFRIGNVITSQMLAYGLACVVGQSVCKTPQEVDLNRKKSREICKKNIAKLFE